MGGSGLAGGQADGIGKGAHGWGPLQWWWQQCRGSFALEAAALVGHQTGGSCVSDLVTGLGRSW